MTKKELAIQVAERTGLTQKDSLTAVDSLFDVLNDVLSEEGTTVSVRGFGAFSVVPSAARLGRNIKTGEPIKIPAKNRVKFKSYRG